MAGRGTGSAIGRRVATVLAAAAFLILSACGAAGAEGKAVADKAGGAASAAAAAAPPAFPPDIVRFDMVCETVGRLLDRPYTDSLRRWPDPESEPSTHRFRLSVDLATMESCGPWCATMERDWIESADAERIVFDSGNGAFRELRRSDGHFNYERFEGYVYGQSDEGRREAETGRCTRAPFTPFPDRPPPVLRERPVPGLATLRARLARYERGVDLTFGGRYTDEAITRIVRDARSEWDRRYRDCRDDACRRAILADRVARLEFAYARRTPPFPGLAFPGGSIGLQTVSPYVGLFYAGVTIFPIIDDRILLFLDAVNTPPFMSICSLAAEGRATATGAIQLRAPADGDVPDLHWEMRLEPGNRLTIVPIGTFHNRYCGVNVEIADTFDVSGSNAEGQD